MSGSVIVERGLPRHVSDRRRAVATVQALGNYELLLAALLGLMTAARLWLVPQYFRADTWLALTTGRDVWHSGLPHHETLTALATGQHWVDQQWLAQLGIYGLYRAGGYALIAALSVLLAAGSFAAVAIATVRWGAKARTVLLLAPVTAFPFFAQSWQPRTQMLAYPAFAALFLLLVGDARSPSRRVLIVLPLLVLWANLHGSVVLGAALVSLRGVVLAWERRGRGWALPAALVALPPLALALTPYGIDTARYYDDTLLNASFKQLASEWQPIVHDPVLVLPFTALAILTVWVLVRGRRETTLWERLALVLLLAAAASAVRNMVWLSLGAVPVLAAALDGKVGAGATPTTFGMRLNRGLAVVAAAAVVVAFVVTLARPADRFERDHPTRYLDAVTHAAAIDPAARVVADVGDADWLLWREPSLRGRVAFDARLELLSESDVHDIAAVLQGGHGGAALRGGAYRIFVLHRDSAPRGIEQLQAVPGQQTLFSQGDRVVILLPN